MLKFAPGESRAIDFGAVPPEEKQKFVMFVASSAANVTARIDGGEGPFRIVAVTSQSVSTRPLTREEIEELPPRMRHDPRSHVSIERTVVGTSDGVTPLAVAEKEELLIHVAFLGEDGAGKGVQLATLAIAGDGFDPISVPISALVGQVQAEVPTTAVSVAQGEAAVLVVTFHSVFGPDTVVLFEMDADSGLSMNPVSVSVPRAGQAQVSLRIEAARFAQPIQLRKDLRMSAFDGRQVVHLPVSFDIRPGEIPIELSPAHTQPIKPDWWQWHGANPRNELWKEDYFVSGAFTNKGASNIQDLAITIFEFFEDAPNLVVHEANLGSTEHGLVEPARSALGAVPPIKKDWQWFIPAVWVVKGPTHREFRYKAFISAKDVNDVPYPSVTSVELRVIVNVSKLKRTSGGVANGAAMAAALLLAMIFFAVAAAAAYAAAAAAGAVALDPPEPDPDFQHHFALPSLGDVPTSGQDRNVILLFRLSERIMQIELTKSLIEGRRLGALAAGNAEWVANHTQDLAVATVLQRSLANEVRDLEPRVKQDMAALVPPATELRSGREQLKTSGLTTELADRMQLPAEHRAGFDALLRSDLATSNPDVAATIDATVAPLGDFVDSLE